MDFVPARKVASLLADHGVQVVVSNACRSANAFEKGLDLSGRRYIQCRSNAERGDEWSCNLVQHPILP